MAKTTKITAVKKALQVRGYSLFERVNGNGAYVFTRDKTRIVVVEGNELDFYGSSLEVFLGRMSVEEFLELAA
jgi:hypothetical protein